MSSTEILERKETGITKQAFEFPKIPPPKKITEVDIGTAVQDVIRKADEERLSTIANTSLLSFAAVVTERLRQTPSQKARDALRLSLKKPALIASALAIMSSSGCFIPNPFSKSQEVPPTPVVVPKKDVPTPTLYQELTPKPRVIPLESFLEIDPANPSVETIKLLFPEEIIHGKSPLIPKGDTLTVSLKLNNDTRISQLSLSLSDLLGIKGNNFSMGMSAVNERDTANIASAIGIFQRIAEFKISDADQKIINKILLSTVRDSNNDLMIKLSLPNDSITIIDKDGSYLVNPAERFATGKLGIGIKRGIGSKLDLAVENSRITNNKDKLVATAEKFDINLSRIKVVSNTAQPDITIPTKTPEATQVPVKPPTPTIQPTKAPTPKPKEEENKWTRKWPPNETVPVQEWWDDMASKGYINTDSTAQRYAGKEINSFLELSNLVPNPVKYGYNGGPAFINNCNLELDKLVSQGQGHIKITSNAYAQIPGGAECKIFAKPK